ncbi:unnamed protein product, partial [marine sediment metagenome]
MSIRDLKFETDKETIARILREERAAGRRPVRESRRDPDMVKQFRIETEILVVGALVLSLGLTTGCGTRTKQGAGIGAAGGALAGAVIGHQSGNKAKGAIIGAVAGAAIGGAVGARLDKQAEELAQIAETRRTDQGLIVTLASDKINFDT